MTQQDHHKLRREDHGIENREIMEALLHSALIGRVGVIANDEPYVVPMNFAYEDSKVYIHGANQGRLIEAIQQNPRICFEIDEFVATLPHPVLCEFDTAYASVICYGDARVIDDLTERTDALKVVARKYSPNSQADGLREDTVKDFEGGFGARTAVIEIKVDSMTGKKQDFNVQDFRSADSPFELKADVSELGNVPKNYHHYDCAISPHRPVELPNIVLKWYEIRKPELIIPLPFLRETRSFLESEIKGDRIELGYGLGFVLLHYTEEAAYLIIGTWKNNQELWESLYIKHFNDEGTFQRINLGVDGPTLCVWDMAAVWHEREAWVEYLNSKRSEDDKIRYLEDQYSGLK
jgi:hypothetical protein